MPLVVGSMEVPHTKVAEVGRPGDRYNGFKPGSTLLRAGHRKTPQDLAFAVDTIFDRDIPVPTRDGTILRADVYRPVGDDKVPAILAYTPYGKSGAGMIGLHSMAGHGGIPRARLSGYECFEGPDPAYWTQFGYAVVQVTSRGIFDSQGSVRIMGAGEGQDGADAVEHVAQLPWCTGSVGTMGNSWLAMVQYHIAAQQPSHLKCMAPLEGASDFYSETLCRGGVPAPAFFGAIASIFSGRGEIEDPSKVMTEQPGWNEYWADKRADFSKVKTPCYGLASYSTNLHTEGSFRCFEEAAGPKWYALFSCFSLLLSHSSITLEGS